MKTRRLGAQGPRVSAIGLGAMNISGFYGPATEKEAFDLLDRARALGVDHIDTSDVYGNGHSEQVIGRYLADRGPVFRIATKAGIRTDRDTGARVYDNSAEYLSAALDDSLLRLGLDRVDLFYVHRREAERPIEEVTEALAALQKTGKIGAFGFSEIAPASLQRAARVHPVAAVQSEYSLATRAPELGLVEACAHHGAALVAFSPVGRGLLTDVPPDAGRVAASAFLRVNPRFSATNLPENVAATDRFRKIAADLGVPTATLAVAWLLHRDATVIPIPGTRNADHLEEAAQGVMLDLAPDTLAAIDAALPRGWAHGDRYSVAQWQGPERYC
jgi:aryl-alcohol dehydrogenase-like predicted oxidoreductase